MGSNPVRCMLECPHDVMAASILGKNGVLVRFQLRAFVEYLPTRTASCRLMSTLTVGPLERAKRCRLQHYGVVAHW
jgi:hypothetical protein